MFLQMLTYLICNSELNDVSVLIYVITKRDFDSNTLCVIKVSSNDGAICIIGINISRHRLNTKSSISGY